HRRNVMRKILLISSLIALTVITCLTTMRVDRQKANDGSRTKEFVVESHESAWLAGVKGVKFGLVMPSKVTLKERYYQEIAPGVALDRVEIVSLSEMVKTPAANSRTA